MMRELINLIENHSILTEKSRGLLFRAKDDRFFKGDRKNPESVLLYDKAEYFPKMPGNYQTHEEMMDVVNQIESKNDLEYSNQPTSASKAFAILTLIDEKTKQPRYFVRFFNTIRPDMAGAWPNKDMKEKFGYQLEKETSLKASYGLKPSDLFATPVTFTDSTALLNALKNSEAAQPFIPGFEMMYQDPPAFPLFENTGEFFTAIRDDLGEVIGPVALVQGLNVGTGAKAAAKTLFNQGDSYTGSSIRFPSGKTTGLVDSYIVSPGGVDIGISSKGESGATASIKNVADGINFIKSKGSDEQKKLLETYKKEADLIEKISRESAINFPLNYAVQKKMMSQEAADAIRELIKTGAKTLDGLPINKKVIAEIKQILSYKGAKTTLPNYNVGYHALSSTAKLVADQVNSNKKFGEACLKFLNSSPIIQLHLKAKKQNDDVAVTGFESKYPPNFRGTVTLDPSKNYSSTAAIGRMNFAYNGVDAGVEPDEPKSTADIDSDSTSPALSKAADIISKGVSMPITMAPKNKKGVGRAKRK